jgi:RNA polymerase sigma-70 factor
MTDSDDSSLKLAGPNGSGSGAASFAEYLSARGRDQTDELVLAELELCFRVIQGESEALRRFDETYLRPLRPHLQKLRLTEAEIADTEQLLRKTMMMPSDDSPPRLAQYDGRGSLHAWLRVSAVRAGLKAIRARSPSASSRDQELLLAQTTGSDPELAYMKSVYREAFRRAFATALHELDPRMKTLLRQSLIDGLSIDNLARLYGAHRATTARWLQSAREQLVLATREEFARSVQVNAEECESVFRLIASHLDISIRRQLQVDPS